MIVRTVGRALVALLVAVVVAAGCSGDTKGTSGAAGTTIAASAAVAPTTTAAPFAVTGADFYVPPNPLPGTRHGDLIWAQPIAVPAGVAAKAWRILYRSESLRGAPIAVSGMIVAPTTAASGPRSVVAWAHGTVGSADSCAPSKQLDLSGGTDSVTRTVTAQFLSFVASGSVVVATDYEGLGTPGPHPFLVGESEGRGVLDAVMAAQQLPGLDAGNQVAIYGVSQGGQAALWAGQIAPAWTPALSVVGVVAAAPFSESDLLLPLAAAVPGGEGYLVLGVFGQAAANPSLNPGDVLDPAVIGQANAIEQQCLDGVEATFHTLATTLGHSLAKTDIASIPGWKAQLDSIKAGTEAIAAPVLILQGQNDLTVPAFTTKVLVTRLCGDSKAVRANFYAGTGHADSVVAGDADLRAFIAERFAGRPATSNCP